MKKPKPEQPPKQAPQKDTLAAAIVGCMIGMIIFSFGNTLYTSYSIYNLSAATAETNRLLSTFQRIDTVKEEGKNHWFCLYEGLKKQYCVNSDAVGQAELLQEIAPFAGANSVTCFEGYVLLEGQCIETIGHARYHDFAAPFDEGEGIE